MGRKRGEESKMIIFSFIFVVAVPVTAGIAAKVSGTV